MCAPVHYGVQYVINPWMEEGRRRASWSHARPQWESLRAILSGPLGAQVETIEPLPGLPDMVFTANAGLVVGDTFVPSRFRYPQRAGEEPAFTNWAERAGFRVVPLPAGIAFEGAGDALFDRRHPILWMGHGFRTDLDAAGALGEILDGNGLRIQPLRLIDPRFYHLDTCFCPLTGGSILYYPAAFAPESRALLEDVVPARERIPVSDSDAAAFACNAVNLDQKIVLNAATETLRSELQGRGFEVFETSLEDFLCAGGAAKCLTLRLDEHLSCEPEPGDFTGVMARIP